MAFAAWLGLLVTALNLLPVGQLDGGHVTYAVFGRRSLFVTIAAIGVGVGLCFYSRWWIFWTGLLIAMLTIFGWRIRRRGTITCRSIARACVGVAAFVVFVLCFTPAPIEPLDLIRPK